MRTQNRRKTEHQYLKISFFFLVVTHHYLKVYDEKKSRKTKLMLKIKTEKIKKGKGNMTSYGRKCWGEVESYVPSKKWRSQTKSRIRKKKRWQKLICDINCNLLTKIVCIEKRCCLKCFYRFRLTGNPKIFWNIWRNRIFANLIDCCCWRTLTIRLCCFRLFTFWNSSE